MSCLEFSRRGGAVLLAAMLGACGGGGGGSTPLAAALVAGPNVARITVNAGPAGTGYNVNRLYTDVTICEPGSTVRCQTINHVLVDTGSTGFRVLSSQLSQTLQLSRPNAANGHTLLNCVQFLDNSFGWGPMAVADLVMGARRAENVPIQVMADSAFNARAGACASGLALNTPAALGANAILGVGLFKEDCGSFCTQIAGNGYYYACADVGCTGTQGTAVALPQQLKNPVSLLASDNNGILIELPAVSLSGQASAQGSLVLGIGTQANNQTTGAVPLTTGSSGLISSELGGKTLSASFIDTGSNGLFFDLATLTQCGVGARGFYCPPSRTGVALTLHGMNSATIPLNLTIDNAQSLFASYPNSVFPTLAGPIGDSRILDLGLPFFYGRRVFIGMADESSPLGVGPLIAF